MKGSDVNSWWFSLKDFLPIRVKMGLFYNIETGCWGGYDNKGELLVCAKREVCTTKFFGM